MKLEYYEHKKWIINSVNWICNAASCSVNNDDNNNNVLLLLYNINANIINIFLLYNNNNNYNNLFCYFCIKKNDGPLQNDFSDLV